jgi:hypothetical protein
VVRVFPVYTVRLCTLLYPSVVDSATATVDPTNGLTTSEAGGTATFSVVLDAKPDDSVTIPVYSTSVEEGTVSAPFVEFAVDTWHAAQTVTVTGVSDNRVDGNVAYTIGTGACLSSDTNFNHVGVADVAVTNTDGEHLLCLLSV